MQKILVLALVSSAMLTSSFADQNLGRTITVAEVDAALRVCGQALAASILETVTGSHVNPAEKGDGFGSFSHTQYRLELDPITRRFENAFFEISARAQDATGCQAKLYTLGSQNGGVELYIKLENELFSKCNFPFGLRLSPNAPKIGPAIASVYYKKEWRKETYDRLGVGTPGLDVLSDLLLSYPKDVGTSVPLFRVSEDRSYVRPTEIAIDTRTYSECVRRELRFN